MSLEQGKKKAYKDLSLERGKKEQIGPFCATSSIFSHSSEAHIVDY